MYGKTDEGSDGAGFIQSLLVAAFVPVAGYLMFCMRELQDGYAQAQKDSEVTQKVLTAVYNDPIQYFKLLDQYALSAETVDKADEFFKEMEKNFAENKEICLSGHSLGRFFSPTLEYMKEIIEAQKKGHKIHFEDIQSKSGSNAGQAFDCDVPEKEINIASRMLGREPSEVMFATTGLSEFLVKMLNTFYRVSDVKNGKKIAVIGKEFISDLTAVYSALEMAVVDHLKNDPEFSRWLPGEFTSKKKECIETHAGLIPLVGDGTKTLEQQIIGYVKENENDMKILLLPQILYDTGYQLDLMKIFTELKDVIDRQKIVVMLDLAHSLGNGGVDININALPVTVHVTVGCGYKHMSGSPGLFGIVTISKEVDWAKNPTLRAWKSLDKSKVFSINDSSEGKFSWIERISYPDVKRTRTSNPPPLTVAHAKQFFKFMDAVDHQGKRQYIRCRSEALTGTLLRCLFKRFGRDLFFKMVTPYSESEIDSSKKTINPLTEFKKRGATLVFGFNDLDAQAIQERLLQPYFDKKPTGWTSIFCCRTKKKKGFEVDCRGKNLRVTPHWAYTSFTDVDQFVVRLGTVVDALRYERENQQALSKG